jgi:pimeloyl-ACP methyl ester carboxylesterase
MPQFQLNTWQSDLGNIAFYTAMPWRGPSRPVVVFLHGALRNSSVLVHWADTLEAMADVVLVDLPGHGRSDPVIPATVDALAASVHAALCGALPGRNVLLVGESLGGLVALAVGGQPDTGPVRAILAADPPLTTAKLWHVAAAFMPAIAQSPSDSYVSSLGREVFGVTLAGLEERIHYPIIAALRVPGVIATGDLPLLPPRSIPEVPCLIDPVDRFVIEQLYADKVRVEQIANCGHLLLVDAVKPCLDLIKSLLIQHVGMQVTGSARAESGPLRSHPAQPG